MNEQEQLILNILQGLQNGDPKAIEALQQIYLAYLQGDLQAAAIIENPSIQQAIKQLSQGLQQAQPQMAAKGAKLNYLKELNGICPEGYKMSYYKIGGNILCKKCIANEQGGKVKKGVVEDFKAKRKAEKAKCGSKLKK